MNSCSEYYPAKKGDNSFEDGETHWGHFAQISVKVSDQNDLGCWLESVVMTPS